MGGRRGGITYLMPGPVTEDPGSQLSAFVDSVPGARITAIDPYVGFDKLKGQIAARGGARDAGAVAAAIGRRKYGKKRFQQAASRGEKLGP